MTTTYPTVTQSRIGASAFAGIDVCREAGFQLPAGAGRAVFDDDVWDFTDVIGLPVQMTTGQRRFDFTAIAAVEWRLVAKELILALFVPRHDAVASLPRAYRTPLHVLTCRFRLAELVRFFRWLHDQAVTSLSQLDSESCERYLAHRRDLLDEDGTVIGSRGPGVRRDAAQVVVDLVNYRDLFTADRPAAGLRPWGGATPSAVAELKVSPTENKTRPVPDAVLQPMLAAACYLTSTLGEHAVALARQVRDTEAAKSHLRSDGKGRRDAFAEVFAQHADTGSPLPQLTDSRVADRIAAGWDPDDPLLRVSLGQLAVEAGFTAFKSHWLPALRGQLERLVAAVGTQKALVRDAELVAAADGSGTVAWTLPLHLREAPALVGIIRTAAAVVLAAGSGMRPGELMELRLGCRRPPEQPVPGLSRYRLASTVFKGRGLGGVPDEWVVIEPVYRAVELLERLHPDPLDETLLLGRFSFKHRYVWFRNWVNSATGARLGLAPIPEQPVSLRALRRTLALELAYRPGGVLAAKTHLKHIVTATTEGYSSRPGGAQAQLLAEVNKLEADRNLELVLAEFRNYQQGVLPAGPGARGLVDFFSHIDHQLDIGGDAPKVQRHHRDVLNLLTKRARTLHMGPANHCWLCEISHNAHYAEHRVMRTRTTIALGQNMIAGWSVGIIWDVRDLLHDPPSGCSM